MASGGDEERSAMEGIVCEPGVTLQVSLVRFEAKEEILGVHLHRPRTGKILLANAVAKEARSNLLTHIIDQFLLPLAG